MWERYLVLMHWRLCALIIIIIAGSACFGFSASGKVMKVLPHFLDLQGRHALSPSLYERDAYQAQLRRNPQERSGLRFDIQWKSREVQSLKLRVEMRGGTATRKTTAVLEANAQHKAGFSKWSGLTISGDEYLKLGELVAWRVTLLDGETVLSEKKSFLW